MHESICGSFGTFPNTQQTYREYIAFSKAQAYHFRSDAEGDGDRPEVSEGQGETGHAVPEMHQPNVEEWGFMGFLGIRVWLETQRGTQQKWMANSIAIFQDASAAVFWSNV